LVKALSAIGPSHPALEDRHHVGQVTLSHRERLTFEHLSLAIIVLSGFPIWFLPTTNAGFFRDFLPAPRICKFFFGIRSRLFRGMPPTSFASVQAPFPGSKSMRHGAGAVPGAPFFVFLEFLQYPFTAALHEFRDQRRRVWQHAFRQFPHAPLEQVVGETRFFRQLFIAPNVESANWRALLFEIMFNAETKTR
jgi:hypothetical protein